MSLKRYDFVGMTAVEAGIIHSRSIMLLPPRELSQSSYSAAMLQEKTNKGISCMDVVLHMLLQSTDYGFPKYIRSPIMLSAVRLSVMNSEDEPNTPHLASGSQWIFSM